MGSWAIDYSAWANPKPFGISGMFRLRNESLFMERAILSHLPYLNEAVLVVQPSSDDTVEQAYRLATEYDKVQVYEYPFDCDWIDTPGFYAKDPEQSGHLVHMSNWAATRCRYSWIAKIEGDVIGLSSFGRIIERIKADPLKIMYYGRVILNLAGLDCDQFSVTVPRNGGFDEAVYNNSPLWRFHRVQRWEMVPINAGPNCCMGWSGLHMKRCKPKNIGWNNETYAPFVRQHVRSALADFNRLTSHYPGPDDPLGEDCLYEPVIAKPRLLTGVMA